MRRILLIAILTLAATWGQDRRVEPIVARKQVALVIGNAAYANRPLKNSRNDAEAMARRLRELNYEVSLVTDAGRKAMGQAVDQFIDRLGTGDVALFYYSGHGMQVEGENYLIPVDFQGQSETDVRYDAHPAGRIEERMEKSGAQLSILVLDACRDNPFRGSGRSAAGGLAAMNAGRGTFIAFATAPGRTASDNPDGRYGLFTQYLLDALAAPGLGLNDVFDLVREKVDSASGGKQLPWTLSSVVGRYSFVPGGTGNAVVAPAPTLRPGQVKVGKKDGQRYVWIPPGKFMMGCSPGDGECFELEKPAHQVEITKGFWLGQTTATVGAWKRYRAATGKPALPTTDGPGRKNLNEASGDDNIPAVFVTWDEAQGFCEWSGGRLPTEAEWEYAARAGSTAARYGNLDAIAWYSDNSGKQRIDSSEIVRTDIGGYPKRLFDNGNGPHPVGQKQPNAWNLYDMLGNVWQLTADWFDDHYYARGDNQDPLGPPGGQYRSLRGGSWDFMPRMERASYRTGDYPGNRYYAWSGNGFRCVAK